MNNVISLDRRRLNKLIQDMKFFTKTELLQQMQEFQEEYNSSRVISKHLICKGIPLFSALASKADTPELRTLALNYLIKLNSLVDF